MKKVNTNVSKRIAVVIIAAFAAFAAMGCSVEKTVTKTESHTDADGNTVTTTTTNHNGTVTEETTTTAAPKHFSEVPLAISNDMGWDIASISLKMSEDDEWSDDFLGDDEYIDDGVMVHGINISYSEDNRCIDVHVADSEGESIDFTGIELPTEVNEEIVLEFEYDAETDSFTAYAIG